MVSALVRRGRDRTISAQDVATALAQFHKDFSREYLAVGVTPHVISLAISLVEAHALRAYDAVQLAAALEIKSLCLRTGILDFMLISADEALNTAAIADGLQVDNPNNH